MGGIYFRHFVQLFCNLEGTKGLNIPLRCAGITDLDPSEESCHEKGEPVHSAATLADRQEGGNPVLRLIDTVNASRWVRLYHGDFKTFEYDLAMEEGNLNPMLDVLLTLWPHSKGVGAGAI